MSSLDSCFRYFMAHSSVLVLGVLLVIPACGGEGQLDDGSTGGGLSAVGGAAGSGGATLSSGGSDDGGSTNGATGGVTGGSVGSGGAPAVGGYATGGGESGGAGTGGAVSAGGQDGTGGAVSAATWADIVYMLNAGCASCHSPPAATTLRPEDTGTNANLHMTLTTHQVKECGGMRLVEPGQPEKSALLMLLNAECTKNGEQFFMPETCGLTPCFPAEWMTGIRLWIEAGAVAQ